MAQLLNLNETGRKNTLGKRINYGDVPGGDLAFLMSSLYLKTKINKDVFIEKILYPLSNQIKAPSVTEALIHYLVDKFVHKTRETF